MKMKYKLYSLKDDDVGKCYITSIEQIAYVKLNTKRKKGPHTHI